MYLLWAGGSQTPFFAWGGRQDFCTFIGQSGKGIEAGQPGVALGIACAFGQACDSTPLSSQTPAAVAVGDKHQKNMPQNQATFRSCRLRSISILMGSAEVGEMVKGDALAIPTEAGIDIFLYWDGGEFVLHQPLELP